MTFLHLRHCLAAIALAVSMPTAAQEAQSAAMPVAAPMAAAEFLNVPEYMLALDLSTGGRVVIQLRPDAAPHHVERIKTLARRGFYNGLVFHRVIDEFMAQGGDPLGTGAGGSDLPNLTAEFNTLPHVRGTLSMARAESNDSANSQFFIMFLPRLALDQHYTVVGRVVSGMEYVDAIHRGEPPAQPSRIIQASVLADGLAVPPPAVQAAPSLPAVAPVTVDQLNASRRQ